MGNGKRGMDITVHEKDIRIVSTVYRLRVKYQLCSLIRKTIQGSTLRLKVCWNCAGNTLVAVKSVRRVAVEIELVMPTYELLLQYHQS